MKEHSMLNLVLSRFARGTTRALATVASAVVLIGVPVAHAQAAPQQKPAAPAARTADPDQSRIGPGDTIKINVYQSPDLSMETRVNETGDISYPLLGRVKLAGLSVTAAEQHIAAELKRREFVKDPQVQIVVTQVRANQVNVLGQVGRPGRYPLDLTGMRLTEVLALAGGIVAGVGSDTSSSPARAMASPSARTSTCPACSGPAAAARTSSSRRATPSSSTARRRSTCTARSSTPARCAWSAA